MKGSQGRFQAAALVAISFLAYGGCSRSSELPSPSYAYVKPPTSEQKRLIVFVHGFGSDSTAAWTNATNKAYWPQLIADDQDLAQAAVMTAGYQSPRLRQARTIEEAAVALGTRLADLGIYTKFDTITFIAHSTGGLVVRRMLIRLLTNGNIGALKRIGGVFFFATPTSGAPPADLLKWLSRNPQTRDLSTSERGAVNTFLQQLDHDWEDLVRQRTQRTDGLPRVWCAYEVLDTAIGPIVPALYSKTVCDETPMSFERDHMSLVKPANVEDDVYDWTKTRLLTSGPRVGTVRWTAGETVGSLVARLNKYYRAGKTPEDIRLSPKDRRISELWIPSAEYERDSWGELLQVVAKDNPCMTVEITKAAVSAEARLTGRTKVCSGRTVCSSIPCSNVR